MHTVFRKIFLWLSLSLSLLALWPGVSHAADTLDVDSNGTTDALTDGILVIRYLFGYRGAGLTQNAIGSGAARSTPSQVESYLAGIAGPGGTLDIDGNNTTEALTDGLLIVRYLVGLRGAQLTQGAIGNGATRTTATQIESYIASLSQTQSQVRPSNCTVAASPTSSLTSRLAPGTLVTLTANCTVGTQPITYSWDGGAVVGSTRNVAPSSTTTYTMTASNGGGSASPVSVTVFVTAATTVGFCTTADDQYDVPWPPSGQVKLGTSGMTNQVVTFRINVPTTFSPPISPTQTGAVRIAEVPGRPAITREVTVSQTPCDFHAAPGGYLWDDIGQQSGGGFLFTINNPTGFASTGANVNFQPGQTYYVSIRNYTSSGGANPQPTCPAGQTCDLFLDFATPGH